VPFAFGIVALLSVGIVVSAYTLRVGLGDQPVMPEQWAFKVPGVLD
jgi:hypothetical protein